jgi:histidinol-phosphate aminotransferase
MTTTCRSFLQLIGVQGLTVAAGACASRTAPHATGPAPVPPGLAAPAATKAAAMMRLDSNENSNGPGPRVLAAIQDAFADVNRYPFEINGRLEYEVAHALQVDPGSVELGCGSSEILGAAVTAFTARDRPLITVSPTFELPADIARHMGHPVVDVPVRTGSLELDLGAMAAAAKNAGLIYLCNPNNPTSTVHGGPEIDAFVAEALRVEPGATILIDEAYHEFEARPDYRTAIPLALSNPRVIVSRTFSKIFGRAGMRVGYAVGQRETLRAVSQQLDALRISRLSAAAALAALGDPAHIAEQQRLTGEARDFTVRAMREAGFEVIEPHGNFMMMNIRRDIRPFQAACRQRGLSIARPFPPLLSYARVTIGTLAEMQRAVSVLREVLSQPEGPVPTMSYAAPADGRQYVC